MQFFLTILLFLVTESSFAADSPSKYALFVGVAKYNHADMNKPQLEFPEDDAKELADIFRSSGYSVDLLLGKQATQDAIKAKLTQLTKKGDSDGVVVLGFFGHGVEFESTKLACYCPFDTTIRNVVDAKGKQLSDDDGKPMIEPDPESLITMVDLLGALRTSPAGNRILLADSCRTSPNKARGRVFGANVKLTDLPENTAALFACSANEQAFEHPDWGHGAFTKCLIEEIRLQSLNGRVTAGKLADELQPKVKALVAAATGGKRQTTRSLVTDVVDFQLRGANRKPSNPHRSLDIYESTVPFVCGAVTLVLIFIFTRFARRHSSQASTRPVQEHPHPEVIVEVGPSNSDFDLPESSAVLQYEDIQSVEGLSKLVQRVRLNRGTLVSSIPGIILAGGVFGIVISLGVAIVVGVGSRSLYRVNQIALDSFWPGSVLGISIWTIRSIYKSGSHSIRRVVYGVTIGFSLLISLCIVAAIILSVLQIQETTSRGFDGSKAGEAKELHPGIVFHWCPPGSFSMGTPGATDDESPVNVTLTKGFWLGETEVTEEQWRKLMGTAMKKGDDFPVTDVSHDEAVSFCQKLTTQERTSGRLPSSWKYSLPTEARWEYACRAGTKTAYSFGEAESQLPDYAWFLTNTSGGANRVGQKKPNQWGLKDMHGNVHEWCSDWYGNKLPGGRNPQGTSSGSNRVNRGGSWSSSAASCRSAYRYYNSPGNRSSSVGFRLAAVPIE